MVFVKDEDFERLLLKISLLENERDRAEGLLRSVQKSARKSDLTEREAAELCDVKTRLLYSSSDQKEGDTPAEKNEKDGEEESHHALTAIETELQALVSPQTDCSPVDHIVSEVGKLANWWSDGWKQFIVPPPRGEGADSASGEQYNELCGPASHIESLQEEIVSKARDCERLKLEMKISDSRLRSEQLLSKEKEKKTKAERDDARTSTREALKKLANLQVRLEEIQERCGQAEKEMIAARSDRAELAGEVLSLKGKIQETANTVNFWKDKYMSERENRRKTHEQLQQIRGNIRVLCRIRPVLENAASDAAAAKKVVTTVPMPGLIRVNKDRRIVDFEYNSCFDGGCNQEQVFEEISPLIMSFADGYNACIFAYGQTGSGKTFTMQGTSENPGIAPRVLNFLFQHASQAKEAGSERRIEVSMLEVYNETVKDLLSEQQTGGKALNISALGPHQLQANMERIPGLSRRTVGSLQEIETLMAEGASNRATTATSMNEHSSRSHAVLSIRYHSVAVDSGDATTESSPAPVLHLVDLAGSERIAKSEVKGIHLKEAQAINKSLSALGDVISSLQQKSSHVPYRNSKLTQLLQDSLCGNSKVLMMCNISPEESSASETMSSLNFAARANQVETGPVRRAHKTKQNKTLVHQSSRSPLSNIENHVN
jgi:kinesin family protein C2/C3